MNDYISTFHTHLAALMTSRTLTGRGIDARMMPVPRKLSSSCGTCVRYRATEPMLNAMDDDVEAVYQITGQEQYLLLMENSK